MIENYLLFSLAARELGLKSTNIKCFFHVQFSFHRTKSIIWIGTVKKLPFSKNVVESYAETENYKKNRYKFFRQTSGKVYRHA